MTQPRGIRKTAFGVFMKACYQECFQNKIFIINKENLENFRKQCSVWWYKLSANEIDQFSKIAQKSNEQNNAILEAYSNENNKSLPTFDTQFPDIHILNYSDRKENLVKSLLKNTEACDISMPKQVSKKTCQKNVKSKFKPPSEGITWQLGGLSSERDKYVPGINLQNCRDIAEKVVKKARLDKKRNSWELERLSKDCNEVADKVLKKIRLDINKEKSATDKDCEDVADKVETDKKCQEVADKVIKKIRLGMKNDCEDVMVDINKEPSIEDNILDIKKEPGIEDIRLNINKESEEDKKAKFAALFRY